MTKKRKPNYRRPPRGSRKAERLITVRSERRDPPDYQKLCRAVIAMVQAEEAAEAEARAAMDGAEEGPEVTP